jgi:hypothetical protein
MGWRIGNRLGTCTGQAARSSGLQPIQTGPTGWGWWQGPHICKGNFASKEHWTAGISAPSIGKVT